MRDASVQCSRDVAAKNCSDYQLLIHTAVPGPYLCSTELSINIVTWRADTGQGKLNSTFASWPPYPYPTFSALPLYLILAYPVGEMGDMGEMVGSCELRR